jgi:hypothetical protein
LRINDLYVVLGAGIEPARLAAGDFEINNTAVTPVFAGY